MWGGGALEGGGVAKGSALGREAARGSDEGGRPGGRGGMPRAKRAWLHWGREPGEEVFPE